MPTLEINIIIKFIKIKDLKIQGVRKLSKGINIRMQRRSLVVLIVLVFIGFPVLIFRLVNLQIVQGEYLQKMASEQQLTDTKINPKRGTIYDRNMNILAQSASVWTVVLKRHQN